MEARLPASVTVSALLRLATIEGGFGTVIARGDDQSGSIIVLLAERGCHTAMLERLLQPDGRYAWHDTVAPAEAELTALIVKRRRFDPDCWVIELDVASAERFAAAMKREG